MKSLQRTALDWIACISVSIAVVGLAPHAARAQADACTTQNLLSGLVPSHMEHVRRDAKLVTDGTIAAEGALWDAQVALMLDSGASTLTYDLGRERQLSAVYVQADANDTYAISASNELNGPYRRLAQFANVVSAGHGLRARVARFEPTTARYLRVSEPRGDGAYSIAELAAYCAAPTPFPPAFMVASDTAASPASGADALAARDHAVANKRAAFVLAAVVLVVLALASFWLERRRRSTLGTRAEAPHAAQAAPEVSAPAAQALPTNLEPLLLGMFVASGCAALTYEVVWVHLLRLVIGASALSVGIVLASFMGGMFIGSLALARWVPRAKNPLLVYACLEAGIAGFGLLMPLLLPVVRSVYASSAGHGPLGIALRALIAGALLLPPTALMGATLPAIARRYDYSNQGHVRLAALYAANTLGAVAGALLSGFYLLAVWNIWVATCTAAVLNLLIAALAVRSARHVSSRAPAAVHEVAPSSGASSNAGWVYVASALSGATALGAQVVWTRLLTLLFGATVYAFSIILAVFLAGLGIGAACAARLLRAGVSPLRGLAATQLGLVPALLWASAIIAAVLPYSSPATSIPIPSLHALHVLRALEVTLPATLLWGMSFPFALAAVQDADPGRATGRVYAANTIGSIAGALLVSFWTIPALGTHWSSQLLIIAAAVSAAVVTLQLERAPGAQQHTARLVWPALGMLALGALLAALAPAVSGVFLAHGRAIWSVDPRDRYPYVAEGAASTVAVHVAPDGSQHFHVAGRVEASSNPADMRLQRLLGHLSVFSHPHPKRVLVVGLGAGVTAGSIALHPDIERIVICEIEPRVVGAAQLFAKQNDSVLNDPRVEVVFDDARHFLATTDERFDIITSDPIHPWVRGNSVLFSREYYQIVQSRLTEGGVASQWVPLYDTSEEAIRIQLRTFMSAFPGGSVWNSSASGRGYDVVLLGLSQSSRLNLPAIEARLARTPRVRDSLREVGVQSAYDLLATYSVSGRDMQAWIADAPENRDSSLKLEYISGLSINQQKADLIFANMTAQRVVPDGLFEGPHEALTALKLRIESMARQGP